MASVNDRLAVIEGKLGIETPKPRAGFFWDDGDNNPCSGILTDEEDGRYECSNSCMWDRFVPFTDEELARFKSLGVTFDPEE
jgi:hypothetical protein